MITNERQFRITQSQLEKLQQAIGKFDVKVKAQEVGSEILAVAELEALKSEEDILKEQIQEYKSLKSGTKFAFKVSTLEELPKILIQARIAKNLSQKELASLLGIKEQQIQRYEAEYYQRASLKRLIEVGRALQLNISEIAEINEVQNPPGSMIKGDLDWPKFPFEVMYKRGYFEGFFDSFDAAYQLRIELLKDYIANVFKKPSLSLHRMHVRTNSNLDEYALLAWEARVLHLASKISIGKYSGELLTPEWISELVKLSRYEDEAPRRAKKMLEQAGIVLIIEPMLPNTYLDGAALLYEGTPVIGLTLRFDRLDNFWFVLLHELYHVIKHLGKNKIDRIFDDLESTNAEGLEREADDLAGEALIPTSSWNMAVARFSRSERSVKDLANKLGISPAIIAGRIRHEANNYIILSDLIGQGKVRNQFPETVFDI